MLVEAKTRRRSGEQARERGLAHRERLASHVIAIELDQIEGVKEDVRVMLPVGRLARRAFTRKPSRLISCSHSGPRGGCGADVGRQGRKPGGSNLELLRLLDRFEGFLRRKPRIVLENRSQEFFLR